MSTLYVTEPGAQLEKEYRRLLVTKDDEVLMAVPAARVDHVVLVGRAGVTTPALHSLLAAGVGLSLITRQGKLIGRLTQATGKNLALRHSQYARSQDPRFCLEAGRIIAQGKLRNYRALARRMVRGRPHIDSQLIARITAPLEDLPDAENMAAVRGLEGRGTRAYFSVLRQTLQGDLAFGPRTRRPPRDPVNALLSLGYTLLNQNLMTACEVVGLDPYDGFFHSDAYGRPALALDLMEEFRGVIVDSVALNLVNRRRLKPADFETDAEGVYLSRRGLQVFFQAYSARIHTEVIHPVAARRLSYLKIFEVQARLLRRAIEGQEVPYQPFVTK